MNPIKPGLQFDGAMLKLSAVYLVTQSCPSNFFDMLFV